MLKIDLILIHINIDQPNHISYKYNLYGKLHIFFHKKNKLNMKNVNNFSSNLSFFPIMFTKYN